MFGAPSSDFRFHLCNFDGELAVERVTSRFDGDVSETDADLRVLRVASVGGGAERVVRVRRQHERVAPTHEPGQVRRPRGR